VIQHPAAPPDSPGSSSQRLVPYLWAIAAVSVALVLRILLSPVLGTDFPFITLFPAVFVVAFVAGFGPAVLATMLSAITAVYLVLGRGPVPLIDQADVIGLAFYVGTGLATGLMGESRLRAHRGAAAAARVAEEETARAEEQTIRAEEEAARAEEETLRAEEEAARTQVAAAKAAAESERVDRILASITDAFLVLDRDWTISYMNQRAAALWGGEPSDYVGRNYWKSFPDTVGGPLDEAFHRALAGHVVVRLETYVAPGDKWLSVAAYPAPEGLTVVGQDVTERMRAWEATAIRAAIVASSEDAIIGKRLDGTVTSWNAAAERIFGYSAEEMIGRSIYTLIPPDLHPEEHEALERVSRGQPVEFSETERIRKDGSRVIIALSVSPIRSPVGVVTGASSIKRDITALKLSRAELASETARSRDLAKALDAAQALVRDLDGRITYWSSGSTRLFGWSSSEAVGQLSHELLRTEFPAPLEEIRQALIDLGQWEGELVHVAKDGRRLNVAVHWIVRQGQSDQPLAVIEVNTDVTARRQAEERTRVGERMEVVGQLAGGVAHEANNQMTVVLGATEFLLRRGDLPDPARQDIEQIREAAERTAAITAQLLAFSRRQVLQPRVLELDEAIQGLEAVLGRTLGERSTLTLRLGARSGRVRADPGQLAQVLLNLVLNARDAMPIGGRVSIETSVTQLTEAYARMHPGVAIRPGAYTLLAVSDTGHGMSPETLRHIFEPFYTTKPVGQGTGLGLATVYGIIKQSDGYVWAYSELGQGTTFKVYLPLETEPSTRRPNAELPARASGEVVLVVEDEATVRDMASRSLEEYGYRVVSAGNGPEALALSQQGNGRVALLITDVIMPGMDGRELARRMLALRPGLPVLFMSGYTDDEIVRRGLLEAGQPFLQKPFTPEALGREVGELLKGSGA
jgi:two-component system, cell cycle sensor histidine kinase and response regulator CckA